MPEGESAHMSEVPWYVSLIVAWLPFILFIGSFGWIGSRLGSKLATEDGKSIAQVIEQYQGELKRSNDLLDQALSGLRTRLDALEKRG
jgi:hypothetical protein